MKIYAQILLYFNTIKYLQPSQVLYRLINKLPFVYKAPYFRSPPSLRKEIQLLLGEIEFPECTHNNQSFNFLNHKVECDPIKLWNNNKLPKLWLYNLHYFNDLKCSASEERKAQLHKLILSWIDHNRPFDGVGWEPYPLSIRIVNLVKWQLRFQVNDERIISSLAAQVRVLNSSIEYHIRGNHLLANAKALVFAGCFFDGPEANKWLKKGMKILALEIEEQILNDGGHFERSPMYHALVLEDMLDLENLFISNSGRLFMRLV